MFYINITINKLFIFKTLKIMGDIKTTYPENMYYYTDKSNH